MLEIEQWVIQNNPNFLVEGLIKQDQENRSLEQNIENIKQAELELLALLESNQVVPDEEIT